MSEPVLKIVQAGDPVLRAGTSAVPPSEIRSHELARLIELMRDTMRDAPGVGLAAPQIGVELAICVIEDANPGAGGLSARQLRARGRRPVPFHVLVNPRLEITDPTPARFFEGCLSVDGMVAVVARASGVRVRANDHRGKAITIDATGWYARILQHEIDHLNGLLYVDRMATRTFMTAAAHARHFAGKDVGDVERELAGPEPAPPPAATASRARVRRPSPGR